MNRRRRGALLLSFLAWLFLGCGIGAALLYLFAGNGALGLLQNAARRMLSDAQTPGLFLGGAAPLILGALSVSLAYRGGLWNTGAVGQFVIGAALAAASRRRLPWSACLLIGALGGAMFGWLSGMLKTRFRVHEALSGLILFGLSLPAANLVLNAVPKGKSAAALPAMRFLRFVSLQDLTVGLPLALFCAASVWLLLKTMVIGYEIRLCGRAFCAGRAAGVNVRRHCFALMLACGALAGLAGACYGLTPELGGTSQMSLWGALTLPAAFLGACHPLAAALSGLLTRLLLLLARQGRIGLAAALALTGGMLYASSLSGLLRTPVRMAVRPEKRGEDAP